MRKPRFALPADARGRPSTGEGNPPNGSQIGTKRLQTEPLDNHGSCKKTPDNGCQFSRRYCKLIRSKQLWI